MRGFQISFLLAIALLVGACGEAASPSKRDGGGDANRGKQVYLAQCTACHASDPAKEGPLGPAVKGSSRELLEARILRGSYPPGYAPKRSTTLMPPQPTLESDIPDLATFLR
jgi:mono/diheme cytochrome c family protein